MKCPEDEAGFVEGATAVGHPQQGYTKQNTFQRCLVKLRRVARFGPVYRPAQCAAASISIGLVGSAAHS